MKMKPLFVCPVISCLLLISCIKEADKGKNALVEQSQEPPGINCAAGGIKIISGIDENRNHGLDSSEIQQTEYVCNGKNALVEQIAEPAGIHCATGGVKVISGIDENKNHKLDSLEIQKTEYVCNGNYDKETIIYLTPDVAHGTGSVNGKIIPVIENFDISNFLADSATFSAKLTTTDENVKAFAELYDITNNKVINNTLLTSNSPYSEFIITTTTVNFLYDITKGPITLGIRLRPEKEGIAAAIYRPMLRLYKR